MRDETARQYEPPDWMEPFLDCLGGRAEVVRLLSGPRAAVQVNAPLALMQQDMEGRVNLLKRLFDTGLLDVYGYHRSQLSRTQNTIAHNRAQRTELEREAVRLAKQEADLLKKIAEMERKQTG